jgi:hypothetical protein
MAEIPMVLMYIGIVYIVFPLAVLAAFFGFVYATVRVVKLALR